jgi:NRPS condensation-like uncharacterized protein
MMLKKIAGEPLNILHTIGMEQLYPIIRMELRFSQTINLPKLKQAIKLVTQVIPQLKSTYNLNDNSWEVDDQLAEQILVEIDQDINPDAIKWNLFKEPQLKVYYCHLTEGDCLYLYLSHILSDGAGFKQLVYLLADCYNRSDAAIKDVRNNQNVNEIMKAIGTTAKKSPVRTDHPDEHYYFPQMTEDGQHIVTQVHNLRIPADFFETMHQKTKHVGATVNDLFLAAFLRTLSNYRKQAQLSLACPTDLRQFLSSQDKKTLRVANFTARYNLMVEIEKNEPFEVSLKKIHREMQQLKDSKQFLNSIKELLVKYQQESPADLRKVAEANYHIRPISYTNLGIVDQTKLNFNGSKLEECIFSGAFRRYPNYQVAFSSFGGAAQLVFNMIGSPQQQMVGQQLMASMAADMFNFAYGLEEIKNDNN